MAGLGAGGVGVGDVVGAGAETSVLACGGAAGAEGACIYTGGGDACEMASFLRISSSQSCCFICNSTMSLESTSLIRLATCVMNSEIDSSEANGFETDSLDGLPFFISFVDASVLE